MSDFETSSPSDVVTDSSVEPPVYTPGTGCADVFIDGIDVTNYALAGSSTRRLNRPSQAQVKLPMDASIGGAGSTLKIYFNGTLHHHGRVLLCETDTGEDTGYTVYNSYDPMEMWQFRPARDGPASSDPGDMSNPHMFSGLDFPATGPEILEQMLLQSEDDSDPEFGEGPLFLSMGTFETDGCNLEGAPTDWPMTIAEVTSLMVSTGCLDVIITPTDPGGDIMGTVSAYNGDYGTDLSGSVVFQYGTGAFNIARLRWNEDMSNMTNKLWYYAGPRLLTPADPSGNQHWCFNVQGDDTGLPDPIPNGASLATLLGNRLTSRSTYGVRMDVQIFDAGECAQGAGGVWETDCCGGDPLTALFREVWRNRWETESWIRQQPRELIHITPTRGTAIGSFDIGDIVGVEAVGAVRGGFSGAQRVFEYTISWDENGVCALSELQTSPTADS